MGGCRRGDPWHGKRTLRQGAERRVSRSHPYQGDPEEDGSVILPSASTRLTRRMSIQKENEGFNMTCTKREHDYPDDALFRNRCGRH